jgi:hypothetical protein
MLRCLFAVAVAMAVSRAGAWNTPTDITFLPDSELGSRVARDSTGNVHLVWYGGVDSSSWQVHHQVWNGFAWTAPVSISGPVAAGCEVAVDSNGDVHTAWNAGGNPEQRPELRFGTCRVPD